MTVLDQEKIMENWQGNASNPLVSINCITYNHEAYIAQTLDGFLMQKTNFPFEILINEDASKDHTASIIRQYEIKFPQIIKPIYQKENQYSQGVDVLGINNKRAKGKYIALCEGDDYWIDPHKLQMQVDWLESHPNYTMCCSDAVIESPDEILDWHRYENDCDIPVEDMILGGGGFIQTATIVYRKILLDKYPKECKKCMVGDYPLQVWTSLNGEVRYLKKKTATYRFFANGSWTKQLEKRPISYRIKHKQSIIDMLDALNSFSNYRYNSTIHEQQVKSVIELLSLDNIDINFFVKTFESTIKHFHVSQKILLMKKLHRKNPFFTVIDMIPRYLEQFFTYLKRPLTLFDYWAAWNRLNWMPDKWYLSLMFRSKMGYWINWKRPKTFNEKLQWLKIYNRDSLYIKLADKYEVRKYIAEKIGEDYLIPLLGVWDDVDNIDFNKLPNQFVLKCTHDSGSVIICKNKATFNIDLAKRKLARHLAVNYYYPSREWPYKNIKPRIIAEQYIENENNELNDYKFFCFDGIIKCIQVDYNRFTEHHRNLYDIKWNQQPFSIQYSPKSDYRIDNPKNFNQMINAARVLSRGIPLVRVDLYNVSGKIFFGELTFYPGAGFEHFSPSEWDLKFGSLLNIPIPKHSS